MLDMFEQQHYLDVPLKHGWKCDTTLNQCSKKDGCEFHHAVERAMQSPWLRIFEIHSTSRKRAILKELPSYIVLLLMVQKSQTTT